MVSVASFQQMNILKLALCCPISALMVDFNFENCVDLKLFSYNIYFHILGFINF